MEFKKTEVKCFAVLPLCEECGTEMDNGCKTGVCYYSCPAQFEMICGKCGKKHVLYENDMPKLVYEKI